MQRFLVFYGTLDNAANFHFNLHIPHGTDYEISHNCISSSIVGKYYETLKANRDKPEQICLIPYVKRSDAHDIPSKKNLPPLAQSHAPHYFYPVTKKQLEGIARTAFLEALRQVRRSAHEGASFGERDPELQVSSSSSSPF